MKLGGLWVFGPARPVLFDEFRGPVRPAAVRPVQGYSANPWPKTLQPNALATWHYAGYAHVVRGGAESVERPKQCLVKPKLSIKTVTQNSDS